MSNLTTPEIFCIIPHYGNNEMLRCCLNAVSAQDYPVERFGPDRVIIIDNNPPHENLLFTRAINTGIEHARRMRRKTAASGPCLFWLLNNDAVAEISCVSAAARCFAGEEEGLLRGPAGPIGLVGSRNLLLADPDVIAWGGSLQCYPYGIHKKGRVSRGDLAVRTDEEWISFSSVFISEAVVDAIGLLDGNMAHIFSDSDYCLRARAQGFRCVYEPTSVVHHAVGSSSKTNVTPLERRKALDLHYFQEKWITGGLLRSLCPAPPPRPQALHDMV